MDGRINLTKESGFSASDSQIMKALSIKDKCKDLGALVSKFSGNKKMTATPLSVVSGVKLQNTNMLTPKNISKVTFHSKSTRLVTTVKSMTASDFIKEKIKATQEDLAEVNTSSRKTLVDKSAKLSINIDSPIKRYGGLTASSTKKGHGIAPQSPTKVLRALQQPHYRTGEAKDSNHKLHSKQRFGSRDGNAIISRLENFKDSVENDEVDLAIKIKNSAVMSKRANEPGLNKKSLDLTGGFSLFDKVSLEKPSNNFSEAITLSKNRINQLKSSLKDTIKDNLK
jgi:hypothetical protein